MNAREFTAIGIDVGGTKIAFGIVTFPGGAIRSRRTIPTLPQRGGEEVLADVERVVKELAAEVCDSGRAVDGIGLGVCELVTRSGEIASKSSLNWTTRSVIECLTCTAPAVIEADVRAAARAEALFGVGQTASVFLYVSIGTGIASCLVVDGEPFLGNLGATGTMASGPLPQFVGRSGISAPASLEQLASGPALVARYGALGGTANSAEETLAAAEAGDEKAERVIQSATEALGGSIGWLVNILDPAAVVLGGGLGSTEGAYRKQLVRAIRGHIWWEGHRDLPICSPCCGGDGGVIGAAAFAWKHLRSR